MSYCASFCSSKLQSLTLLNQFCPKSLFWLTPFPFWVVALPLSDSSPVGFDTNRAWMPFAAAISPTAVSFGRVIYLWGLFPEANINFASTWPQILIRLVCGDVDWISHDWLNDYIQTFWMHHQVHNALFTVVANSKIRTSRIVWILPFTPLKSYFGTFTLSMVFFFEIAVLRCTCF